MPIAVSNKERMAKAELSPQDLRLLCEAMAADIVTLRTQLQAALAKLDADAGVTDTNYASTIGTAAATYYVGA